MTFPRGRFSLRFPVALLLAALILGPASARADLDEPRTRIQAGIELQAMLVGPKDFAGYAGAFAAYQLHRYFTVGIEGGSSYAGVSVWRAGVMGEVMPGADFLRPYVRLSVEALGMKETVVPALGFQFGVAIFPIDSLIIVPSVGFDGNLKVLGNSVGTLGASIRYRF
jgi:hypothetical protein